MVKLYQNLLGKDDDGLSTDDFSEIETLNSQNIRDNNKVLYNNVSKEIVLTMGEFQWVVTYVSKDRSGNVILTLWLAKESATVRANPYDDNTTSSTYPANMYSTSEIRAVTLNNGGPYATGISKIDTATPKDTNQYAKFTMDSVDGNFTDYIVKPEQVAWQETVSAKANGVMSVNLNCDAYSTNMQNFTNGYNYQSKQYYDIWKSDNIWLPALAEVGITGTAGLWKVDQTQRANSKGYWSRSARENNTNCWHCLAASGNGANNSGKDNYATTSTVQAARPAFHLNLTKAEEDATRKLKDPTNVTVKYNSELRTVEDFSKESWYVAAAYKNSARMTVTIPSNAIKVGEYTVYLTPTANSNFRWSDDSKVTKEITLTINPKPLGVDIDWNTSPHVPTPVGVCKNDTMYESQLLQVKYTDSKGNSVSGEPNKVGDYQAEVEFNKSVSVCSNYILDNTYSHPIHIGTKPIIMPTLNHISQEYNGSNRTFEVEYSSGTKDEIAVSVADEYVGKIKDADGAFRVIPGGVYTDAIKLHLVNGYDPVSGDGRAVWSDTNNSEDRYLTLIVSQKALDKFTIRESSGGVLNGKTEGSLKVTMDYTECPPIKNDATGICDEVNYIVYAQRGDRDPIEIARGKAVGGEFAQEITLDFSKIYTEGEYKLKIEVVEDEKNYTVDLASPITLNMTEPTGSDDLKWRLEKDGVLTLDSPVVAQIGDTSVDFPTIKVYDSSSYTFNVIRPNGYEKGDVTYTKDGAPVSSMKDAGTYEAKVMLSSGGATQEYKITFKIDPYKFDLSQVKWENDGIYEYTGSQIEPTLDNLPSELAVSRLMGAYSHGTAVKEYGEVTVVFDIADSYTKSNYILPEQDEAGSFDGDFIWTISWKIIPVQIKMRWDYKDAEDGNNVPFKVLVLTDERIADKVDYEYYETDENGNIINDTPLSEDEIEVNATQAKYYKAKPVLQVGSDGNYEFPVGSDEYSPVFSVGGESTAVKLSLTTTEYDYTGKAVSLKWATGTPTGSLKFTYYAGDAFGVDELESAPKDAGTYWVEAESNNGAVALEGETHFQFIIKKSVISTQWKSGKPPVLSINKSVQVKEGIEYEYYDADMHKIEYGDLSKGGTFYIRAVLKDAKNFEFDNGEVETEKVEFSLVAGEELRDPSDINNPNYTFDDGEDPSIGDNTPSGNDPGSDKDGSALDDLLDKLKELPLWQLIASAISIIVALICFGKGFGYAGKTKQTKRTTESRYRTYYAGAFLGLAFSTWTVIACVLIGLAFVSVIFLAIMKSKYNKAVIAQEDARLEYERNKKDEDKENMRMMLMGMMGGNSGGGQGGYAYAPQGFSAEEMRLMINDAVTALLPNAQQYLPQQASTHDDEIIKSLVEGQKAIMHQLEEQNSAERIVEREVVATSSNDEMFVKMVEKAEQNDETIKQLLKNQEMLMEKIVELSANGNGEPQIIEKIVEVPVEKVVEKIVEKEVKVHVAAPSKPKKEIAPRLTLDEAYA
ncbi:MAG: hypothetical protein K2I23_07635, partial [Clostridia bacterium]|nr:hypothetical protein [Clostridia bacterium]